MFSSQLLKFYLRDLNKLKEELTLFKNENDLWITKGDVKNPPGNLALHLNGNLKHFIGAQLGETGYVRERDKEFADKSVPLESILKNTDETIQIITDVFSSLSDEDLQKEFPIEFLGNKRTIIDLLFILYGHLNYHLGQINYQRRLLGGVEKATSAVQDLQS